jgi:hypothetical protein
LDRPLDGAALPLKPVTVQAHASDADGVASFEFFVDDVFLVTAPGGGGRLGEATVGWTPTTIGTYTIRARAIDSQSNIGSEATSLVTVGELPVASPTASPAPEEREIVFFVEPEAVPAGGCAVLVWEVGPPAEALLDGQGVPPAGEREVCPEGTRLYELLVPETGQIRTVTLHVEPRPEEREIIFFVEPEAVPAGGCAMLVWEVGPPAEALLDGQGVPFAGEREVCPEGTRLYELLVPETGQMRTVTLRVEPRPEPTTEEPSPPPPPPPPPGVAIDFRADNTNIAAGNCTTLRWDVEHATAVYLDGAGVVGHGSKQVCPGSTTTYTLHVEHAAGATDRTVTINVTGAPPPPPPPFTADLAVTDLYPETLYGPVYGRVTNHGPGTLTNVTIQFSCQWVKTDPIEGIQETNQIGPTNMTITSLSPGQTTPFNTAISVDLHQFQYDMTCTIHVPFSDPNGANNSYSETFP